MEDASLGPRESLAPPTRKVRREKTFTGCWGCRSRKVKCDETVPECTPCRKRGFKCSGYRPILVWVAPNQNTYLPGRRRILQSNLTWHGYRIYNSLAVDDMIERCDIKSLEEEDLPKLAGPFTVFSSKTIRTPHPRAPPSNMDQLFGDLKDPQLRSKAQNLFSYYTTHTALNMMPFKDRRNPWISFYPSMAQSGCTRVHKSLRYAILAQAAGNLAHLCHNREEMSILATRFYAVAIKQLRESLEENVTDFSVMLASILTLIMAEMYGGKSNAWRVHLNGAWNFLMTQRNWRPWERSEEAWVTAQSLCLLKIRSDTMEQPDLQSPNFLEIKKSLIFSVASRGDFGFTVGASQGLIRCIYDITSLPSQIYYGGVIAHQNAIDELYQRLLHCNLQPTPTNELILLHHQIFQTGVLIYFHRCILNSKPRTLIPQLDILFSCVTSYQSKKGGHIALWPVFIGAVEVYQEEHKRYVRTWLDKAEEIGAASRGYVRSLVEAVWQERRWKRDEMGEGIEEGEVIVDWSNVMRRMEMDVLLV